MKKKVMIIKKMEIFRFLLSIGEMESSDSLTNIKKQ